MKFSVGYNHDKKMLGLLDAYKDHIESFYFPIPRRYTGSGRHILQQKSYENEIPGIIKKCDSLNIRSQLLLNATCDGASGLKEKRFSKIIAYIRELRGLGLKSVVVTNPVYISGIKERVKGIEVETSVNCYVKTVEQAVYLKELGADVITIDRDINRDIPLIRKIKKATGSRIKILLNEGCLRNCPFRHMHANFAAHAKSNSNPGMLGGLLVERWCLKFFSQNPARIFSVPFIPPEALKYYIQCVDYFKLSTRDSSTLLIEFRLKAYIKQNYNGNLLRLLDCPGLAPYYKYIDSRALNEENFFEKMLRCPDDCGECDYCRKLTDKAVITDSCFLDAAHPVRIKESVKAERIYGRILKFFPSDADARVNLAKAQKLLKKK